MQSRTDDSPPENVLNIQEVVMALLAVNSGAGAVSTGRKGFAGS
jgi:hypothetical protein